MPSYLNAYEMIDDLREAIDDHSTALVQGTRTGAFSNKFLLKKINDAQRLLYSFVKVRFPSFFNSGPVSLTASSSIITLPADFESIIKLSDSNGMTIFPIIEKNAANKAEYGSQRFYIRRGNTLVIERSGMGETYDLFYVTRPRDLTFGRAADGAANSITLSNDAKAIADYYNDMLIENVTQDWTDTITDYSSQRVCTLSLETGAEDDYYGLVSELPEPLHRFIPDIAFAMINSKSKVALDSSKSDSSIADITAEIGETLKSLVGEPVLNWDDMLVDTDPDIAYIGEILI